MIGASLLCVAIVLSNNQLRPIAHRVWAGKLERETGSGPWAQLDERIGFLDIRVGNVSSFLLCVLWDLDPWEVVADDVAL